MAPTHRNLIRRRRIAVLGAAALACSYAKAAFSLPAPGLPRVDPGLVSPAVQQHAAAGPVAVGHHRSSLGQGLCGASALLALGLGAGRLRTAVSAAAAGPSSSSGPEDRGPSGVAIAAFALLATAGLASQPALAEEAAAAVDPFPLDLFNPWESFVNLNAIVINSLDDAIGSAGIALVIYTCFAKLITYPIYGTAARSNALLRIVGPQVRLIQKQYANDESVKNKAIQTLYKKVGVNPLDAILPLLTQLPVFLALYYAIKKLAVADTSFREPFLWIPSLSGPVQAGQASLDWLINNPTFPDAALYLILPVLLVTTQLTVAKFQAAPKDIDAVAFIFPCLIGASCLFAPQGLGIYWFTNSLITAAQTSIARQQVDEEFPDYKKTFDEGEDTEGFRKGDTVIYMGKTCTISYGPDTDGECKVKYENGSESEFIKATSLRRPGVLGESVQEVVKEAAPTAAAPKTRKQLKQMKQEEARRKRRAKKAAGRR